MAARKKKRVVKRKTTKRKTVKKKRKAVRLPARKKISQPLAIVGLVLNILVLPGLGTLIAGKIKTGIVQIALVVVGMILTFTIIGAIIGLPLIFVIWIWGIVTGAKLVQEAS